MASVNAPFELTAYSVIACTLGGSHRRLMAAAVSAGRTFRASSRHFDPISAVSGDCGAALYIATPAENSVSASMLSACWSISWYSARAESGWPPAANVLASWDTALGSFGLALI